MFDSIAIEEQKQKRDSLSISLLFHFFLLLLLLVPIINALSKEPEKPQFEGIQVALGYKEAYERTKTVPAPSASTAETKQTTKKAAPPKKKLTKAQPTKAASAPAKKVVSKTLEKEAEVVATKKKSPEKSEQQKAKEKAEEIARKKAEEAAAKAEAERQAKEEAAKKAAEEAAKLAAAKSAAKSKFNNILQSANGNGAPSKGDPSGHPDAAALEGISKGKGKAGNGLGQRGIIYAPTITDSSQRTGRVVVNICVNAAGKVISSNYTQKGSTTTDSHLIALAVDSAKKYKFSANAAAEQCGDITIDFRLK